MSGKSLACQYLWGGSRSLGRFQVVRQRLEEENIISIQKERSKGVALPVGQE